MTQPKRFENQVIIVTGASRGIGRATAQAFAREGAHVIINYFQDEAAARQTLAGIEAEGQGHGTIVQANVGEPDDCQRLVATAEGIGPVTTLVNNAAGFNRDPFLEVDLAEFDRVWNISVRGLYYLSQLAARKMAERRRGSIVHVSSILAKLAIAKRTVYCAGKGAVEALTRAMALDLATDGIRVNAVAPGLIETEALLASLSDQALQHSARQHIPSHRFGRPEEIAQAILFLASEAASYINGAILAVDSALGSREAGPLDE